MPTTDPARAFDPANFMGTAQCGPLIQCGNVDLMIGLHVKGDGGAYFSLALGKGRKEIIAFLGAEEWPAFLRQVETAKAYYARLSGAGKCDEITPLPPAG